MFRMSGDSAGFRGSPLKRPIMRSFVASLTHLSLDKMAAILQTIYSDVFSWKKNFYILKFDPKGSIENNTVLA